MANKKSKSIPVNVKFSIRCTGGDGAYLCVEKTSREIYEYFQKRNLDLARYSIDEDYAKEKKIPKKMRPFEPGLRAEFGFYKCVMSIEDDLELLVETESYQQIYSGNIPKSNIKQDKNSFDLIKNYEKGIYVVGYEGLEDCYIEGDFELTSEFDIKKFKITYGRVDYDISSRDMFSSITYNGEEINWHLGYYEGTGDNAFEFVIVE